MGAKLIRGKSGALKTKVVYSSADKEQATVYIEGPFAAVNSARANSFVPGGYTLERSSVAPDGAGFATLTLECVKYNGGGGGDFGPIRTSFEISLEEVQYNLEDHPHLKSARRIILCWLATEENKRISGNDYQYLDESGSYISITDGLAKKFCAAYMAGIKTFNRYYPVIAKKSVYKNPPGMIRSERSFTGGSPTFSAGIGTYNDPPLTLNGYPSGHWFKSHDGWVQNENKTWTRTEQWTYTPEASSGDHGWIYTQLS